MALSWLGGVLLFPYLIHNLWTNTRLRKGLRPLSWVGGIMAAAVLALCLFLAPADFRIDRLGAVPSVDASGTTGRVPRLIAMYDFWGFRNWPATRFRLNVAASDQDYSAGARTHQSWDGTHNAVYGKTVQHEFRPLSLDDLAGMFENGSISDQDIQAWHGKGYECLTRTDHYFGPFVVIRYLRDIDKMPLGQMREQCRLVDAGNRQ